MVADMDEIIFDEFGDMTESQAAWLRLHANESPLERSLRMTMDELLRSRDEVDKLSANGAAMLRHWAVISNMIIANAPHESIAAVAEVACHEFIHGDIDAAGARLMRQEKALRDLKNGFRRLIDRQIGEFDDAFFSRIKSAVSELVSYPEVRGSGVGCGSPEFDRRDLCRHFENLILVDHMSLGNRVVYRVVDEHGSDRGVITFYDAEPGMSIEVDNFPGRKKYYSTGLPVKFVAEFLVDVRRVGLDLVVRKNGSPVNVGIAAAYESFMNQVRDIMFQPYR